MSKLRPPLREHMKPMFDEADAEELVATLEARRRRTSVAPSKTWWPAVAAAAALLMFGGWYAFGNRSSAPVAETQAPGPLRLVDGTLPGRVVTQTPGEQATYAFADGSRISIEARAHAGAERPRGAALQTIRNEANAVSFELESGSARVDIKPGGQRSWRIHTELAVIEVLGTQFEVVRGIDQVHVAVTRGKVAVHSEHIEPSPRVLTAGQSVTVRRPDDSEVQADAADAGVTDETSPPNRKKTWRAMARAKKFDDAYRELGKEGIKREAKRARTVAQLFELSDVARSSGHPEDAIEPLTHLVHRFPHDARAGTAAFTLGRIYMTKGDAALSAAAFERAIVLGVSPSLREAAHVRAIEMHRLSGDKVSVRRAIDRYLSRFPRGHHVNRVKTWSEELDD